MVKRIRVATPPPRPLLVFDGDCGFCRWWVARWKSAGEERFDQAASQEIVSRFPEIPAEAFRRAVQLILPDGDVFEGAHAVFRTVALPPGAGTLLRLYENVPAFARTTELAYRAVARHRGAGALATRVLWGPHAERPTYAVSSAIFLRLLGLVYLVAFLSLWVQIQGLVGSRGILPVARLLEWAAAHAGGERYWVLPTLCWLHPSDAFLTTLCAAGTAASLLLIFGFAPALCLTAVWALYLSLSVAGQTFLEFQWDLLLLETGFLAIFLAPPVLWRLSARRLAPSRPVRLLLWWLLFRLVFSSGMVKLSSGDANWRSLTALQFHYETQPLPPWTAWFLHQLPASFHKASAIFLFAVELAMPFLIFAPRRLKLLGASVMVFLQLLIAATGNYAFFNLLAILLCLLLVDDSVFRCRAPAALRDRPGGILKGWPRVFLYPLATLILFVSAVQFSGAFRAPVPWPGPLLSLAQVTAPFRTVNGYGLFSVMTTARPEIVVEGSDDGRTWRAYEFRWKPGDPMRRPRFVAPHQPRLDWQMWFAALGRVEENPLFVTFLARLLEGSPPVLRLLDSNPFSARPPRYVRAVLYDYHFTDRAGRRATGAWWRREPMRLYCPAVNLEMLRGVAEAGGDGAPPLRGTKGVSIASDDNRGTKGVSIASDDNHSVGAALRGRPD